jgi:hypothetical protein
MRQKTIWLFTLIFIILLYVIRIVLPHLSAFEHDRVFATVISACVLEWILFFSLYQTTGRMRLFIPVFLPLLITFVSIIVSVFAAFALYSPKIDTIVYDAYFIASGIVTVAAVFILSLSTNYK